MGFGQTRFAAPDNSFQLIYLARNLTTAVAETVVRDRGRNKNCSQRHAKVERSMNVMRRGVTEPEV
ncbi:hypothetical protein [Mesorhizobium comanense]|uniref:hypothetical protein n=1 Tax=Mesorhizobium comanense TaxID=2502215 RepID=UPI002FC3461D